ncbi:WecB/TagA/CpsF family glycosyltransferase [Salibacter halophilus]|uniref:WecB/TagA/CpsF family glycosyltransferase n=1 Tax=Salibacter halophilus TaxID=1803916 RepID=A0A6N6MC13_9FLAO|nr:WecB/TagA/CpsF family glycosyltransferase [Salibacter halophilus]KAB1064864.1 WecB/TagA/CpsF family glycosyltransferase [Salibacter halophilus]
MLHNTPIDSRKANNSIFGIRLDSMPMQALLNRVEELVKGKERGYITFCNVHMLMEAEKSTYFKTVLKNSTFNLTDGMPLVKILQFKGNKNASRTAGPDTMPLLLELSEKNNWSIALYGGSEKTLSNLKNWVKDKYPSLKIACAISPPFRKLSNQEEKDYIQKINESGTQLLFVGLGCPKQEIWMSKHVEQISALMFGVGGAFSMVTGEIARAPVFMQKLSLEWLYRFSKEPSRLFYRYVWLNFKFLTLLIWRSIR